MGRFVTEGDRGSMRNYFDVIADNKEIFRINISLQGAITLFKDKVIALTEVGPLRRIITVPLIFKRFTDNSDCRFTYLCYIKARPFQSYSSLSYIWMGDKDEQIDEFVQKKPSVMEIRDKFTEYEELITTVNELPEYHVVGPIRVNMGKR